MNFRKHKSKTMATLTGIAGLFLAVACLAAAESAIAPQKKSLDNGLPVIYQKDTASGVTVLTFLIRGGQKAEPDGMDGLSYITTRLSVEIPDQNKVQDLMVKATRYSLTSKGDYSLIQLECLSESLEDTLKIFAAIMMDPLFSGLRINFVKENMAHLQNIQSDDSVNVGRLAQLDAFFGKTGYGRSIFGTEESLKKIKGRDIENFYKQHFQANRMACAVISDLDSEKVLALLQKHLGKFPAGEIAPASDAPAQTSPAATPKEIFIEKKTKQCLVSMAFSLPATSAKTFTLNYLLENLMGKGPGSRLWGLRSEEKLAYNVNAQVTQMKDAGTLEAYLETDAAKTEAASEALRKVLAELYEKGLGEEELQTAKVSAKAQFLRYNETKDKRASTFVIFEGLGLGYDFFAKFPQELEAVTLAELNAHIKNILAPEKASLVVVGPKK
jgi:zinc protease